MAKTKEEKQADKVRRAQLRAFAIQLGLLAATAGSKAERYAALRAQLPALDALLAEMEAA